jgi:hypothetical protein
MKTVIIISIIVVIVLVWFKSKINKAKANPIDSINFAGCMGINLGDSWKSVLSRMLHLKLITKETSIKYQKKYEEYIGDPFMEVGHFKSEEHFNNVKDFEFVVRHGVLESVQITFIGEQYDTNSIMEIVQHKLTRKYGTPLENKDGDHFFMWMDRATGHMLILSSVDNCLSLSKSAL